MKKRITILVVASVLTTLAGMGAVSHLAVRQSIQASLRGRLALAQVVAESLDTALANSAAMLRRISVEGSGRALEDMHRFSLFGGGVFTFTSQGALLSEYPPGAARGVELRALSDSVRSLKENELFITSLPSPGAEERICLLAILPVSADEGGAVSFVAGRIDQNSGVMAGIFKTAAIAPEARIEIISRSGVVIFSSDRERILAIGDHNRYIARLIAGGKPAVEECHSCHSGNGSASGREDEILVFVPLSSAPLGLAVMEPESSLYGPATGMRNAFLAMGAILAAASALLAIGLSESIVKPIHSLIGATRLLAREQLSSPIDVSRNDEIGILAKSFETMRERLAEAMEEARQYGVDLERRVMERAQELEIERRRLSATLSQLIRAQEEERLRVARELHDETSQAILALGMSLEVAAMELRGKTLSEASLMESRLRAHRLLDGIKRIIRDLRPPALDDLGLESSIRWLLESHLKEKDIQYTFTPADPAVKLGKESELRLFRVIQEAVINIARHSGAKNASVSIRFENGLLKAEIRDDGAGFDLESVWSRMDSGRKAGFGLLGMRERMAQINGSVEINSSPGAGTAVTVAMPAPEGDIEDEKNKASAG